MWFNSIGQLPFYQAGQPCYCEPLAIPNDMILQGSFPPVNSILGFAAVLQSPDGLTTYETITSYIDIYYFELNGLYYFNARLKRFSPKMCIEKCWIIEFIVYTDTLGTAFDKYTQRYCTASCCETAAGVTFTQDGVIEDDDLTLPTTPTNSLFTDDCGDKLVRLITRYPCFDNFSGDYYGTPTNIIGAFPASFALTKVTSLRGRFVRRPREITRQISYNCKLQRAESARQYLLESYDIFPDWKMIEIENQLHAPYIWVEDENSYKEYQFTGGVVFGKPDGARDCTEFFQLSANISDCIIRQTFGCEEPCSTSYYGGYNSFFIIPSGYTEGNVYDGNKTLIASDINSLVDWLRAQEGITDVEIIASNSGSPVVSPAISPISCGYDYVIGIKAENQFVYIPTSLYFNKAIAANKIYSVTFDEVSEICDLIAPVLCATPVLDYYTLAPVDCATPVLDYYTLEPVIAETVDIIQYIPDNWDFVMSGSPAIAEDTSATVFNSQVVFSIKVRNDAYPMPDDEFLFSQTRIGVLGSNGRPQNIVTLNSENSDLAPDQFIIIDAQGIIYYSGAPTSVSIGSYSEVLLTNLTFNI